MHKKEKPDHEELRELAIVKGYSAARIASRYDTSPEMVRRWLHDDIEAYEAMRKNGIRAQRNVYGQPRRVRGE